MAANDAPQNLPALGTWTPDQMRQLLMEKMFKYRGINFQKMITPLENLQAMETFPVRDDDIFIVTYPKCGTHWTMEIVFLILADGYPDKIDRREKMTFGGLEMTISANHSPSYKMVETLKSPRVLPTHLPENVLPPQVFENKGKVVYVGRNPKDCLTSMHRFLAGNTAMAMANWNETFERFLSGDIPNGSWFDFNLNYWKHRHDDNFIFLKYEDMKRDTKSAVKAIADHIGCVLSDEAVDRVVENCSMSSMRKSYKKADDEGAVVVHLVEKGRLTNFLRKGTVGDWKNIFTVAQNEKFDEMYREKMAGSGLLFEFE